MSQFCARSVIQDVVTGVARPDGFITLPGWNTVWTPNYNGVNSYVEFEPWEPEGEFELRIDAVALSDNNTQILGGNHTLKSLYLNTYVVHGTRQVDAWIEGTSTAINTEGTSRFLNIRVTNTTLEVNGKSKSLAKPVTFEDLGITKLGRADSTFSSYFKGQLSNLKLIDKTNPDNSRFYSGIIYSDEMPNSTVLIDEWNKDVITCPETTYIVPDGVGQWEQIAVLPEYPYIDGGVFYVETEVEGLGNKVSLRLGEGQPIYIDNGTNTLYFSISAGVQNRHYIQEIQAGSPNTGAKIKIKITKVTHGLMYNFGTTHAYVRLIYKPAIFKIPAAVAPENTRKWGVWARTSPVEEVREGRSYRIIGYIDGAKETSNVRLAAGTNYNIASSLGVGLHTFDTVITASGTGYAYFQNMGNDGDSDGTEVYCEIY